jgi:hypothetical protein
MIRKRNSKKDWTSAQITSHLSLALPVFHFETWKGESDPSPASFDLGFRRHFLN